MSRSIAGRTRVVLRLFWRVPLLLVHLLVGIPLALLSFVPVIRDLPGGGMKLHQRTHLVWSRIMLRIFGVRLAIQGRLPDGPCLIVANHISWLDIVLLHALWPMWLVAKSEIRGWPMIGHLAAMAGTLFVVRGSETSRRRISRRMTALLKRGDRVGIFPEAGIAPDVGVGRFHARLFAPALRADVPAVPVAIRYYRDRDLHDIMVFGPGESFFANLWRLLCQPACAGQLMIGSPVRGQIGGRSQLARECNDIVKTFYESRL